MRSRDSALISPTEIQENTLETRLMAITAQGDALSFKGDHSVISKNEKHQYEPFEGTSAQYQLQPEDIEGFSSLINGRQESAADIAKFLYAIIYSSHALLESIKNPSDEVEEEINKGMFPKEISKRQIPVYQSLKIQMPNGIPDINHSGQLNFTTKITVKEKNYIAKVMCEQEGNVLYFGKYTLRPMDGRIIIRMAKNIPE